jgi:hypothetical protein
MKTVFVIQIVQLVMRTKLDIYHLVDASPDGLLVSDCIIRSLVSVSALAWLIRYIYYWNLQFLNNVMINKTNVLIPQI